jgi:hypothetical protein
MLLFALFSIMSALFSDFVRVGAFRVRALHFGGEIVKLLQNRSGLFERTIKLYSYGEFQAHPVAARVESIRPLYVAVNHLIKLHDSHFRPARARRQGPFVLAIALESAKL